MLPFDHWIKTNSLQLEMILIDRELPIILDLPVYNIIQHSMIIITALHVCYFKIIVSIDFWQNKVEDSNFLNKLFYIITIFLTI